MAIILLLRHPVNADVSTQGDYDPAIIQPTRDASLPDLADTTARIDHSGIDRNGRDALARPLGGTHPDRFHPFGPVWLRCRGDRLATGFDSLRGSCSDSRKRPCQPLQDSGAALHGAKARHNPNLCASTTFTSVAQRKQPWWEVWDLERACRRADHVVTHRPRGCWAARGAF